MHTWHFLQKIFGLEVAVSAGIGLFFTSSTTAATVNSLSKAIKISNTSSVVAQALPGSSVNPESDRNPSLPQENPSLQPTPTPSPALENNQPVTQPIPENVEPCKPSQPFFVKKIEVKGSTVFSEAELNPLIKPFEGKTVTKEQLCKVADAITQLYIDRGYITSRADSEKITVSGDVVQIPIIEGSVEKIEVEGNQHVNSDYIINRINLAGLNPLRKDKLEDQLNLLRIDPLFKSVDAILKSCSADSPCPGKSIITVRVREANPIKLAFSSDNYSPPSVGAVRLGAGIAVYNSVTGKGDRLAASYNRSTTGGANLYDFSYLYPLNTMNGTLEVRAAIDDYKITDPKFASLNIRGNSNLYELSYRQPLERSPRQEFALSLGFKYQDGQTFVFNGGYPFGIGPDKNGVSRTGVFTFGQDYIQRDPSGAWLLQSQFNLGTGFFDGTINNRPTPDSRFFSWLGQVQRVQQLGKDQLILVEMNLQLTPNSLLPSEQFIIGGGQSVRGYRQNVRYGDNGFRFSLEDRITLLRDKAEDSLIQIAPFVDMAVVWNHSGNPNVLPSQTFLPSAGLGLILTPTRQLAVRLDYGMPFVNLQDRGNDIQDSGLYFSVRYQP